MISVYTVLLFFPVVVLGLLFWPIRVVWGYVVLRRHGDGTVYAAFSRRAGFVFLGFCVVGYALFIVPFVSRDAMSGVTRFLESGRVAMVIFLIPINLVLSAIFSREKALRPRP